VDPNVPCTDCLGCFVLGSHILQKKSIKARGLA
jgi:hypothetical protein